MSDIKTIIFRLYLSCMLLACFLAACNGVASNMKVSVIITGGYDTDPRDGGRPIALVAAALGVPPEVFREAFSHVKPAPAGQEPDPAQVNLNKEALLNVLGPYGVTNDSLDRVSNYYRFNGSAGETWPRTPATVAVIVTDGKFTGVKIINAGSGYSSTPIITISGVEGVTATAVVSYTTDFNTNGSITAIHLDMPQ
jgi:hypothetical protein